MKQKNQIDFFIKSVLLILFFFNVVNYGACFAFNANEKAVENLFILPFTGYDNATEISVNKSQYLYLRYTQEILIKECQNANHAHHVALQWYLFCRFSKTFQWVSLTLTQGQWRDFYSPNFYPPGEKEDNGAEIEALLNSPYSKTGLEFLLHQLSSMTGSGLSVLLKNPFLIGWKDHMYSTWVKSVLTSASQNQENYYVTGRLPHEFVCTDTLNVLLKYLMCEGKLGLASLLHHTLETFPYRTIHVNISTQMSYGLTVQVTVSTVFRPFATFPLEWNASKEKDIKTLMTYLGFNLKKEMQWRACSNLSPPTLHIVNPWMTKETLFPIASYSSIIPSRDLSGWNSSIQLNMTFLNQALPRTKHVTCHFVINNKVGTPQRLEGVYVIQCVNHSPESRILRYYGSVPRILYPLFHTLQFRRDSKHALWIHGMKAIKELNMTFHFPLDETEMICFVFQSEVAPLTTMVVQFTFWKQFVSRDYFAFAPEKGLTIPGGFYYVQLSSKERKALKVLKESFYHHLILTVEKVDTMMVTRTWIRRTTGSLYVLYALPEINMTFNTVAVVTCVVITFLDRITRFTLKRYTRTSKVTMET